MKTAPTNSDDMIDSRDVIARIEELESNPQVQQDINGLRETDDATELVALRQLQDEAEDYAPDWRHGCTLIRNSYFKSYAQELADDIGAIPKDASWPSTCIDWDQAARELQMDYSSVEFDGVTYWVR